jgi:alcohol dehydrogenase
VHKLCDMVELFRWLTTLLMPKRFPPTPLPCPSKSMAAVVMKSHGGPGAMEFCEEVPAPTPPPKARYVTVDILAAGVNPVDFKLRVGPIASFLLPKPKILGSDFAGIVAAVPHNSRFHVGQRVFGMLPLLGSRFGAYASRCCIQEENLCVAPAGVPLRELAVVPLVACTILQSIRPFVRRCGDTGTVGKKCLIQGASGGVGTFAVQYCANVLGMHVVASCSTQHHSLMFQLGASEVIDYRTEDFTQSQKVRRRVSP